MTWVDLAVLGFLAISGLLAFARGFVREVLGLAAWGGSVAIGIVAMPFTRGFVSSWVSRPDWVDPASFVVGFLISLIVLTLVASALGGLVRRSALGGLDRTLGLVYGIGRGAFVLVIAYILGQMVFPIQRWPAPVLNARALPPVYEAARWVRDQLPEAYRPHTLEPPPAGRQATSDALLHATPRGTATGKQPDSE